MNINEFSKPITANTLNETLAKKFGTRIDIDRFTTEQLQDARNKLRTKLSQVETTESFDAVQTDDYTKNKLFLDVLNAAISERDDTIIDAIDEAIRKPVREGAEDEAELVMASKDMVDRITGWMEDTAEMQTESMLELADAIRDEHGQEKSEQFVSAIKPSLEQLYSTMETTRETLISGVGMLTGESEMKEPMGADDEMGDLETDMEPTDDIEADGDMDLDLDIDTDDDFGADAAAAGGEEEGGREKRESRSYARGKQISEISKKKAADYIKKASDQKDKEDTKGRSFSGAVDGTGKKKSKTYQKRSKGVDTAFDKLIGRSKVPATESKSKKK